MTMTKLIVKKVVILGLLGAATLAASVVPASAHKGEKEPPDPRPSGCRIDPGMSPKACFPDWYQGSRRPKDNGLPPCGIIYNGPCDPKKGI